MIDSFIKKWSLFSNVPKMYTPSVSDNIVIFVLSNLKIPVIDLGRRLNWRNMQHVDAGVSTGAQRCAWTRSTPSLVSVSAMTSCGPGRRRLVFKNQVTKITNSMYFI